MRSKSPRARKCPVCHLPAAKSGRNRSGTQRWRCGPCELTFTSTRPDLTQAAQFAAFLAYITGKQAKNDLAGPGWSRSTLNRKWAWCWGVPIPKPVVTGEIYDQLFIDGIYLPDSWVLLTAVNHRGELVAWQWGAYENKAAYKALLEGLAPPLMVTTDGAQGALTAVKELWEGEGTVIQRCLLHIHRNNITDLTSRPKTPAGQALLRLSQRIGKVRDLDDLSFWQQGLAAFHAVYGDWLKERSFAKDDPEEGKRRGRTWWYTHDRDRRVYQRLNRLNREGTMWNHLTCAGPGLTFQPTTNQAESLNASIRRLLDHHRGLSANHMQTAVEWLLHSRSEAAQDPNTIYRQWDQAGRPTRRVLPRKQAPQPKPLGPARWGNTPTPEEGLWVRKGWAGRWTP